jgi:hypothetical protein
MPIGEPQMPVPGQMPQQVDNAGQEEAEGLTIEQVMQVLPAELQEEIEGLWEYLDKAEPKTPAEKDEHRVKLERYLELKKMAFAQALPEELREEYATLNEFSKHWDLTADHTAEENAEAARKHDRRLELESMATANLSK